MKNYLVVKNYSIVDQTKWYNDRTFETDLTNNYKEMEDILLKSAKFHLADLHDIIVHRGQASNIRDVFRIHFKEIYDIWSESSCNILYCDLDVIFVAKTHIFNQYNFFAMFNFTDPPSTKDDHYNLTFEHFFNCGIRYYPHNMRQDIWDLGFEMLNNWNPDRWDSEQVIYNNMLWSQDITLKETHRPNLAFQMLNSNPLDQFNVDFNKIEANEASVFHLHGSRGSAERLKIMKQMQSN